MAGLFTFMELSEQTYKKLLDLVKAEAKKSNYQYAEDALNDVLMEFVVREDDYTLTDIIKKVTNFITERRHEDRGIKRLEKFSPHETDRYCKSCGEIKPIGGFYQTFNKKWDTTDIMHECKECWIKRVARWRKTPSGKESIKRSTLKYYENKVKPRIQLAKEKGIPLNNVRNYISKDKNALNQRNFYRRNKERIRKQNAERYEKNKIAINQRRKDKKRQKDVILKKKGRPASLNKKIKEKITKLPHQNPEHKICKKCISDLPISEFYPLKKGNKIYYNTLCKKCHASENRKNERDRSKK